jgi:homoserine kinase
MGRRYAYLTRSLTGPAVFRPPARGQLVSGDANCPSAVRVLVGRAESGYAFAMRVRVRVPATSANLGPGFDALGLALALYNEVTIAESDSHALVVSIEGEGSGRLDTGGDNVVARGARMAFEVAGRPFRGAAIHCVNRIPLSRGLGSSAAAWVGGLAGANALLGDPIDRQGLVAIAARAEGHPDNVAAAVLGGLTVSCADGSAVAAVSLRVPPGLRFVVLVPELESATREARAVLPNEVSRADAVFNVQRVSLLLAALASGRIDLLSTAMHDRLHQPYRLRLFPWMEAVAAAAREAGALGCVLSGAGPSMLAVVPGAAGAVARAMAETLASGGLAGRALELEVDVDGVVCAPCEAAGLDSLSGAAVRCTRVKKGTGALDQE